MKRILLASVAALGLVGTASAADLAVRAPVAYVPAFTWTGCYLGANGGWIGGNDKYTSHYRGSDAAYSPDLEALSYNTYSPKDSGGTFGGQFGCQFQAGSWVIGGEWDWNWSGLKEDNTYIFSGTVNFPNSLGPVAGSMYQFTHKKVDWFSTARARVGLAWDRVLVYATGGLAYAGYNAYTHAGLTDPAITIDGTAPLLAGAYDENRFGWTVGGGLEWAFSNNWTAKAEFLYLDFGSFDYTSRLNALGGTTYQAYWNNHVEAQEYVARIGVNYLFHTGGAPVVARY